MTDDDRLAALGRLAREEESVNELEERLVRLTHGELSPEEIADLEREADPEAIQAHRPLDDEFKKQVESRLEALLPPEKKPASVTPIRPRWVMPAAVAALVAAAAAILLFLNSGTTHSALPGYELAVSGGVREVRGNTDEPVTVAPGSRLTLVVRPSTATSEKVAAFVFAKEADALTSVPTRSEASAGGALKLDVAEAELPKASAAETTLVVIVGRADVVASSDAARALLARGSSPDYQILEARVRRQK